jgi:hypothetical protein
MSSYIHPTALRINAAVPSPVHAHHQCDRVYLTPPPGWTAWANSTGGTGQTEKSNHRLKSAPLPAHEEAYHAPRDICHAADWKIIVIGKFPGR